MTTHGTQLFVDTEAARDDVVNLREYAAQHLKLAREVQSLPDDILAIWTGTSARRNMGVARVRLEKMLSEYDRLYDLSNQLFKTILIYEEAEKSHRAVAEHYYQQRGGAGSPAAEQTLKEYGYGKPDE